MILIKAFKTDRGLHWFIAKGTTLDNQYQSLGGLQLIVLERISEFGRNTIESYGMCQS